MLKLVNDIWVKGVLEKSLYTEVLIDLGLEERKDAVERPWDMVLQMHDQADQPGGVGRIGEAAEAGQDQFIQPPRPAEVIRHGDDRGGGGPVHGPEVTWPQQRRNHTAIRPAG